MDGHTAGNQSGRLVTAGSLEVDTDTEAEAGLAEGGGCQIGGDDLSAEDYHNLSTVSCRLGGVGAGSAGGRGAARAVGAGGVGAAPPGPGSGDFDSNSPTASTSAADAAGAAVAAAIGMGLHSSTFQLNLRGLYGIGRARRGCVARVKGGLRVFSCVRHG